MLQERATTLIDWFNIVEFNDMKESSKGTLSSYESAGDKSMEILLVEKERTNEKRYRTLYTDLLKRHRGLLSDKGTENLNDFQEESSILKNAMISERDAWIVGVGVGVATFLSLRLLPKYMIWRLGGDAKLGALREAQEKSKANKTNLLQGATALLVEGSFSAWAGYRGYQMRSQHSEDTYEMIAQIPLCKGRSAVSESLCDEWVNITRQIPAAFWQNQKDGKLHDVQAWNAIQTFAVNCLKRQAFEVAARKEQGIMDRTAPVVLPTRVPEHQDYDVAFSDSHKALSDDEVESILSDK